MTDEFVKAPLAACDEWCTSVRYQPAAARPSADVGSGGGEGRGPPARTGGAEGVPSV